METVYFTPTSCSLFPSDLARTIVWLVGLAQYLQYLTYDCDVPVFHLDFLFLIFLS